MFAERRGPIAMRSMLEQLGLSTEVAIKLVGFDEKEFANRIKRAVFFKLPISIYTFLKGEAYAVHINL